MKIILIVGLLLVMLLLVGCGFFHLTLWVAPDDLEFLEVVESLDTLEKISDYMTEYFTFELHAFYAPSPYRLWREGKGDCNDFTTFVRFVANYHGYETWKMNINWSNSPIWRHTIPICWDDGSYRFFEMMSLVEGNYLNFRDIVYADEILQGRLWCSYKVYDWDNNLIEKGVR